jgi:hypothetical protein
MLRIFYKNFLVVTCVYQLLWNCSLMRRSNNTLQPWPCRVYVHAHSAFLCCHVHSSIVIVSMSMVMMHVHVHGMGHIHVHGMVHVHVHGACSWPSCMSRSRLQLSESTLPVYVNVANSYLCGHAACPCLSCMSMNMMHVHCSRCFSMSKKKKLKLNCFISLC